jgi:hypothetical protein
MNDFLDFAQRLLDIVHSAWIDHSRREGGMAHSNESDRQLILAYVHAFRRFRAIKRLAEDERPSPEAVMVLTRSLVSLTHRALYLVSSDDPDIREEQGGASPARSFPLTKSLPGNLASPPITTRSTEAARATRITRRSPPPEAWRTSKARRQRLRSTATQLENCSRRCFARSSSMPSS